MTVLDGLGLGLGGVGDGAFGETLVGGDPPAEPVVVVQRVALDLVKAAFTRGRA